MSVLCKEYMLFSGLPLSSRPSLNLLSIQQQGQVEEWAAKEIEERRMVISKLSSGKQHRLMSGVGRREARVAGLKGPHAERERTMQRVRKWVEERAREGMITAAMLKDMKRNLRLRGEEGARDPTHGQAVAAAVLILVL